MRRSKTDVPEGRVRSATGVLRRSVSVRGVVQGVGFRPFVYRLARDHGLAGWVLNHSGGVEIEIEGPPPSVLRFVADLRDLAPPLARIEGLSTRPLVPEGGSGFEIRSSIREEGQYQLVSPDIATCADCAREVATPSDRRFRYPFTNCTNCGPRFTIITDIPYDRPLTTMGPFTMCKDCQAEYDDPLDRRFHAQPNACSVCGPQVWFRPSEGGAPARDDRHGVGGPVRGEDAIAVACELLVSGGILAVKGLGGFHLACDATDEQAVAALRDRKRRPAKPLAVMAADLDVLRLHCTISADEERLLTSPECPIVLLRRRPESSIVRQVAPGTDYLGAMLPYTPLHHIILQDVGRPLVMTSGNLSEEPIAVENEEAMRRLEGLADGFLLHNRDIHARYDDSVWYAVQVPSSGEPGGGPQSILQPARRSRGYAPFPIKLQFATKHVLACGPELKNTFCLTRDDYAFVSQHIGDMENLETLEHFEQSIELYKHLFRVEPEIVAHDLHPAYLSTQYALSVQVPSGTHVPVQHHHAHVVSCLVDNGWAPDRGSVIGVAWDGTGYGTDGHIWGGEFLVANYEDCQRVGQLEYLPMAGGEASIRNPYRLAIAYQYALGCELSSIGDLAATEEIQTIQRQVDQQINCPLTSSAGRLFDAVSALLRIRGSISYEAQAAVELEAAAMRSGRDLVPSTLAYPFAIQREANGNDVWQIRLAPMLRAIAADIGAQVPSGEIAQNFHATLAQMIVEMCQRVAAEHQLRTVALSGGCFQNRLLLGLVVQRLRRLGFVPLVHGQVPCNDGGVSLGQAAVAHFA